jgi:glycosyltransferase involved in cell wall biosynthesis
LKISIITISFNVKDKIEKTILSVINQTYSNIEYIIIDGNSKDGTIDIINKYRNKIDIIISEDDDGIYDAFNKGIKYANGDLIAFLNAGDYYDKDYCDFVNEHFPQSGYYLCTNVSLYNKKGDSIILYPSFPNKKISSPPFLHPSLVVKRCLFLKLGNFNLKFNTFSDFDWMLKLTRSNLSGNYINETKVHFEYDGISSKFNPKEYIMVLKNNEYNNYQLFFSVIYYSLFHIKIKILKLIS